MKSFLVPRVLKSSQGCHYPMVEPSIRKQLPYGSIFACFPENPKVFVSRGAFIFNIWVPSWRGPHPPHWVKNLWCRASISVPLGACLEVRFFGRQVHILFTRTSNRNRGRRSGFHLTAPTNHP